MFASAVSMKDECGICGRVMRTTYMRQCQRCKKLFCRDCMTPDVATGDPMAMLCLHCARRVVSPRTVSKYAGLESHLKFRAAFTDTVKLKFARIDGLIGSQPSHGCLPRPRMVEQHVFECSCEGLVGCRLGSAGSQLQRRLRSFQKSPECSIQEIQEEKTRNYPALYPCPVHNPNQRFRQTPKFQNSTPESRTSSGNEPCPASR